MGSWPMSRVAARTRCGWPTPSPTTRSCWTSGCPASRAWRPAPAWRAKGVRTPILMLTVHDDLEQRVAALDAAAAHGGTAHAGNRLDGGADVWVALPLGRSPSD